MACLCFNFLFKLEENAVTFFFLDNQIDRFILFPYFVFYFVIYRIEINSLYFLSVLLFYFKIFCD